MTTNNIFIKACASNIPKINIYMINDYIKNSDCFNDPELRGSKAQK